MRVIFERCPLLAHKEPKLRACPPASGVDVAYIMPEHLHRQCKTSSPAPVTLFTIRAI